MGGRRSPAVALLEASATALGELVEVAEIALAPCHIGWIQCLARSVPAFGSARRKPSSSSTR